MRLRVLALVALLTLSVIIAHDPRSLDLTSDGALFALRFQNIAISLMRDSSSNRKGAIDLYWQAYSMAGQTGTPEELERRFGELYVRLQGGRTARVTLTASKWEATSPSETVILTRGRICENLLLVISNGTKQQRTFSISGGTAQLNVIEQSVTLVAGGSTAIFISMVGWDTGRLSAALRIATNEKGTVVPFECEVRPSGRMVVRLLDEEGHPTAARIYLSAADGFNHIPEGSIDRAMWVSGEHFFYADGLAQADLPEGKAKIEVVKGFDYVPVSTAINIEPGKTTWCEIRLKRLENMSAHGWYSGDEHIHGNYTGDQFITPGDDLLMIRAEDLNVGNMMVSNSAGAEIHDEQYFEGKPNTLSTRHHLLYWNEEMRTYDLYGHLIFLNLKELVRPIYTGFPGTPNWEDYPSNYTQAKKGREQGGFTAYAHPTTVFDRIPPGSGARESVVDVALGMIDALEVFCTHNEPSMALWYRFLNCGFKLGISAGSDAFINHTFAQVPGGERVYVNVDNGFSYSKWIEGLTRGRAFATSGPLLFFEVEGQHPGREFHLPRRATRLRARARVSSWIPVTKLEIVANGEVIAAVSSDTPTRLLQWDGIIPVKHSSWVAARVWGPEHRLIPNAPSRWAERRSQWLLLAHSGASYIYIGNSKIFSEKDRNFFIRWIDDLVEEVKARGKFATSDRQREVIDTFLRARGIYEKMTYQ